MLLLTHGDPAVGNSSGVQASDATLLGDFLCCCTPPQVDRTCCARPTQHTHARVDHFHDTRE